MKPNEYEDEFVAISVKANQFPDVFQIELDRDIDVIAVKRLDSDSGWGQDLNLVVKDKNSQATTTINVGPSCSNTSYAKLDPADTKLKASAKVHKNELIPKRINLCYRSKDISPSVIDELQSLNPDYEIHLSDDKECREFLGDEFGGDHADCFSFIPDGPIKADFWRVAIMLKRGGVYFDADVKHIAGIHEYLHPKTTFLTSTSWLPGIVNPIVIMCRPGNQVLQMCTDWYASAYRAKFAYSYWGWSICGKMSRALQRVIGRHIENNQTDLIHHSGEVYQFVNEDKRTGHRHEHFTHWRGFKILNNHRNEYVESPGFRGFKSPQGKYEGEKYEIEIVDHPYKDTFDISVDGDNVTLTRTDDKGGWGQHLWLEVHDKSKGQKAKLSVGPSDSNKKKVEIIGWNYHRPAAKKPKMLVILAGEAFRRGGQGSRKRDVSEAFEPQKKASASHMKLIRQLKEKWGIDCEIMVNSYKTKYEKDLLGWYEENLLASSFRSSPYGLEAFIRDAISEADLDSYDSVFVCRLDLEFKDFFMRLFDPRWDRMMFPSMCWRHQGYVAAGPEVWIPRISDTMVFVPKGMIDKIRGSFHLNHAAWAQYNNDGVPNEQMGLMVPTFHDSDSAKDYNPMYRLVGRPESKRRRTPNVTSEANYAPRLVLTPECFPDWCQPVTEPYEDEEIAVGLKYDDFVRKEQFSITVDKQNRLLTVTRIDEDNGWDMNVMLYKIEKKNDAQSLVMVGPSEVSKKTVALVDFVHDTYEDDKIKVTVQKTNHPDKFHIEMKSPRDVCISRIDENSGWGQDMVLSVEYKNIGKKDSIKVGPSESRSKTVRINNPIGFRIKV